ncbi:hypothetical protein CFN78_21665 [Amycolatopsis antarctica]|uniref:GerMN domain-containing protein n=1 Tax=Amycolatopsis antarctica TaxID=1854586 RepID=A0A263CYA7_9PSEU|nr:hypothetical protein CFN78_21665 [Amycolatopsis antarctica]
MLLLAVCTGCGVGASEVIPGAPGPDVATEGTPLYFVRDGELAMVLRSSAGTDVATALAILPDGVSPDEAARGFTTEVSPSAAPIDLVQGPDGAATVSLAIAPDSLSPTAMHQIACTARTTVRLTGDGITTDPVRCPVR